MLIEIDHQHKMLIVMVKYYELFLKVYTVFNTHRHTVRVCAFTLLFTLRFHNFLQFSYNITITKTKAAAEAAAAAPKKIKINK